MRALKYDLPKTEHQKKTRRRTQKVRWILVSSLLRWRPGQPLLRPTLQLSISQMRVPCLGMYSHLFCGSVDWVHYVASYPIAKIP